MTALYANVSPATDQECCGFNTRSRAPIEQVKGEGAVSDDPSLPERTVNDIVLKEVDREIIQVAARLFMALEPGETRETAAEEFVQNYRDNLAVLLPASIPTCWIR